MNKLANYAFEKIIHSGSRTKVSLFKQGSQWCVIKNCVDDQQFINKAMIPHEYDILKSIQEPGIIKVYDLIYDGDEPYLVLEYFPGENLRAVIESDTFTECGLSQQLPFFFELSLKIADSIKNIHAHNIIHKDINPQNILYDPNQSKIKIIDFGLSSTLKNYTGEFNLIQSMAGTLAYMSPEQTGRTNHVIDFQSDLYSLGIVLYQLITGKLPFVKKMWVDYIYAHIAEEPISPHQLNSNIPEILSDIILKLMNKSPDNRYKSIQGLINDLIECQRQWITSGTIIPFALGQNDPAIHLKIPDKLYGRLPVMQKANEFEAFPVQGGQLLVVKGLPGIGKSTFIEALKYEWVKQQRKAFEGQYEQFKRNVSYSGFIQCLRSIVKDILKNDVDEIVKFKSILHKNGVENLNVLCEQLRELELITGQLPPAQVLDPQATQKRLETTLLNFILSCAEYNGKLILILDDMQWADLQSNLLIEKIINTQSEAEVLLCCTTRSGGEYDVSSFTTVYKELMQGHAKNVCLIDLPEINSESVAELLSDTLSITINEVKKFSSILHDKTGGNPLFIKKMLDYFYDSSVLKFDFSNQKWIFDLAAIEHADVFNDLSEFLLDKIKKIPEGELAVLSFCACLGKSFSYKDVLTLSNYDIKKIYSALKNGITNNIIIQEAGNIDWLNPETNHLPKHLIEELVFKFSHDKLQQACLDILAPKNLEENHSKIARQIIDSAHGIKYVSDIIELCSHLNKAPAQFPWQSYCYANLQAGSISRSAGAFQDFVYYRQRAYSRMPQIAWSEDNTLASQICNAQAEVYIFQNELQLAEDVIFLVQKESLSLLEKMTAAELHLTIFYAKAKWKEGMQRGIEYINQFYNKKYPINPSRFRVAGMVLALLNTMKNVDILKLKQSSSEEAVKLSRLCANMLFCGFPVSNDEPEYFFYVGMIYMNLVLEFGANEYSYMSFILYALLIFSLGYKKRGLILAESIMEIMQKQGAIRQYGYGFNAYSWAMTWKFRSFRDMSIVARDTFNKTMEIGDYRNATYNLVIYLSFSELAGYSRQDILQILDKSEFCIKDKPVANYFTYHKAIAELLIECNDPEVIEHGRAYPFEGPDKNDYVGCLSYYTYNAVLQMILSNYQSAVDLTLKLHEIKTPLVGTIQPFYFMLPFCLMASYEHYYQIPWRYRFKLKLFLFNLKRFSHAIPDNFEYGYFLTMGEYHRLKGNTLLSLTFYQKAITSAINYKNLMILGVAYERTALLLASAGFNELSREYFNKCAQTVTRYGATTKLNVLENKYNIRLEPLKLKTELVDQNTTTMFDYLSSKISIDMTLFSKAANVISSELDYTRLLSQLLDFAKTASGAEKIALLTKNGEWKIEAFLDKNKQLHLDLSDSDSENIVDFNIVSYVIKTREMILIDDAERSELFSNTDYTIKHQPKSVLVFPLIKKTELTGILYLENNLSTYSFSNKFIDSFNILSSQIAVAIENSSLFTRLQETRNKLAEYSKNLEKTVAERTKDLSAKNLELNNTLNEVKQLQTQLIQTERILAMNDLTKGLSHELKNPLNFISNFGEINLDELLQIITDFPDLDAAVSDKLMVLKNNAELIVKNCNRINDIVVLMEEHGQIERDICSEFNIKICINNVLKVLKIKYKDKLDAIEINTHFNHNQERMIGFVASLSLALEAILNNAIYTVLQKQKNQPENYQPRIDITTHTTEHQTVIFEITDNGEGINEAILNKIWQPFFTTKQSYGVGLGLSIAYGIITSQHRGEIQVESILGAGTTFRIILPSIQLGFNKFQLATHTTRI